MQRETGDMITDRRIATGAETLTPPLSDLPTARTSGQPAIGDTGTVADIRQTLSRLAQIDATAIDVAVAKHVVALHGYVRCWSERDIVDQVAWSAPGVAAVHNHLVISYPQGQSWPQARGTTTTIFEGSR